MVRSRPPGRMAPATPVRRSLGQGQVERDVDVGRVPGFRVPDGLVGAETAQDVGVGGGRGGDHPRLRGGEQRDHRGADAAGRADDQHGFAGPHLGGGHQRAGGQADGGQRRRLLDVEAWRAVRQERGVGLEDRVLGQRAGAQRRPGRAGHRPQRPGHGLAEDLVAHLVGGHARRRPR